jgi:hypothetical protein
MLNILKSFFLGALILGVGIGVIFLIGKNVLWTLITIGGIAACTLIGELVRGLYR